MTIAGAIDIDLRGKDLAQQSLVGLWVGNNSGGDFANLTITPVAG